MFWGRNIRVVSQAVYGEGGQVSGKGLRDCVGRDELGGLALGKFPPAIEILRRRERGAETESRIRISLRLREVG